MFSSVPTKKLSKLSKSTRKSIRSKPQQNLFAGRDLKILEIMAS